ncbi:hypothetical protein EVAR_53712_1 [Eumeta japonica]|uniref:Uncharacterized protein n=1 Tax=Eumeta variegata TaxID=151549 RepID=A0A4C1YZ14_EUMVA|nr:hypothetical protein EVAR_53712_1 [Eumeta japonica]
MVPPHTSPMTSRVKKCCSRTRRRARPVTTKSAAQRTPSLIKVPYPKGKKRDPITKTPLSVRPSKSSGVRVGDEDWEGKDRERHGARERSRAKAQKRNCQ